MKIIAPPKPKKSQAVGVTVLMNHQIFCTSPVSELDFKFMHQMQVWCEEYQKDVTHNG